MHGDLTLLYHTPPAVAETLCLPATFISPTDTTDIAYTWIAASGDQKHRIDYITVPLPRMPFTSDPRVLQDIDTCTTHIDHWPVALQVAGQTKFRDGQKKHFGDPRPSWKMLMLLRLLKLS